MSSNRLLASTLRKPELDRNPGIDFASQFRQKMEHEDSFDSFRSQAKPRRSRRVFLQVGFLLLLITFSAFQANKVLTAAPLPTTSDPTKPIIGEEAFSPTPLMLGSSQPVVPTLPAETPVILTGQSAGLQSDELAQVPSTPAPDPLRFSFPQPPPAPVSAWRPPLYPSPWALSPYDHFYFTRPIAADEVNWPLWDYRYGGVFFDGIVHTGIDITAPKGTPVLAAGPGEVVSAGYGLYRGGNDPTDPYGLAVSIRHDFGYQGQNLYTVYGHMDRVDVVVGQHVEAGEMLGLSGETGKVTGPHLHFEVRLGENSYFATRNPELWLVPPQGWGVLVGRVLDSARQPKAGMEVVIQSKSSEQNWLVKSYGKEAVNSDAYYRENLVIGDLPAGFYDIRIPFYGVNYKTTIQIRPGEVTYFTFLGRSGFDTQLPDAPGAEFSPDSE